MAAWAAFVAEYAVTPAPLKERVPFTDEVMTILPPSFFRCGTVSAAMAALSPAVAKMAMLQPMMIRERG